MKNIDFYMVVEDCFHVKGRGTVLAGKVEEGSIKVGDKISLYSGCSLVHPDLIVYDIVIGFCHPRPVMAEKGDNAGLLIRNEYLENCKGLIIKKAGIHS